MKEIIVYGELSNFSIASFIKNTREAQRINESIEVLLNSPGGDPIATWGAILEFRNFRADKRITVHGEANSAAAYFLLFANNVQAIEQSSFVYHRAQHIFEQFGIELDEGIRLRLDKINSDLRSATEDKLNVERFLEIASEQHETEVTLDRFFDSNEPQLDVLLDAEQAREVGLIKKVLTLTPNEADILNMSLIAASTNSKGVKLIETEKIKSKTNTDMTLEQLKEKHPEVYAQAISEAATPPAEPQVTASSDDNEIATARAEGAKQEQERVAAWMAWNGIAPERVKEGIKSGKMITAVDTQELTVMALKSDTINSIDNANNGVDTDTTDQGDGNSELKQFEASVGKILDATARPI